MMAAPLSQESKADLARGFEGAIVETLAIKCKRALLQTDSTTLAVAGGVGVGRCRRKSAPAREIARRCDQYGNPSILSKARVLYRQWRNDYFCGRTAFAGWSISGLD